MTPSPWRQIIAIAHTTLVEAIQQPVAFLIQLTAILMTLIVPIFQFHHFSEDGRLARDSGLSCMLIFGLLLAAGTAGQSVAKEISRGTAAAVIGKPVARTTFIIAKWLGVLAIMAIFWGGTLSATLLTERSSSHFINLDSFTGYSTDKITLSLAFAGIALALVIAAVRHAAWRARFGVTAFYGVSLSQILVVAISGFYNRFGKLYLLHNKLTCAACVGPQPHNVTNFLGYHLELNMRVIPVAILILFALVLFAALTTALATRFQTGTTLTICATLLFLGLTLNASLAAESRSPLTTMLIGLIPDIQNFWLCDALAHGGRVAWLYVVKVGAYTATFCILCLTAGCWAFQQQDLG